jgi:adenosylcobinamide kinase/adenosylcobinamide-phosphate guanylyltransferase
MSELPSVTLVLGGARSGKSAYAENLIGGLKHPVYLATAEANHGDDANGEMAARIAEHRERRGPQWRTLEEPLDLAAALSRHAGSPVLVDCLTLWLANILAAGRDVDAELDALADCLAGLAGPVVLVSNEVGQGIVPDNALARSYMDHAGRMNQRLAAAAHRVVLVHAGLPQILKDDSQ